MFWVASAPLNGGHVNVSPKGLSGMFHVVDGNKVWYQDLTGSGSETMAHLREPGNGRITIMFNSFGVAPLILRLWGTGTIHEFGTPEYETLITPEDRRPGSRCAVVIHVDKVGTSCGWGVPVYDFQGHRATLTKWLAGLEAKDQQAAETGSKEFLPGGLKAYWAQENTISLDGLPGLQVAHETLRVPRYEQAVMGSKEEQEKFLAALKAKMQGPVVAQRQNKGILDMSRDELVRLVLAFSLGLAVAAAYMQVAGLVRC